MAAIRPTTFPFRRARNSSTSAWVKKGFFFRFRKSRRSATIGGTKYGSSRYSSSWKRMNSSSSRVERTGVTSMPVE